MPEFTGRLRTPRLPTAPTSPVAGEMYYDTAANKLYYWNGTAWTDTSGGTGGGGSTISAAAIQFGQGASTGTNGAGGGTGTTMPLGSVVREDPVGAFNRNADQTVSVRDAGWYTIDAQVGTNANLPASTPVGAGINKNGTEITLAIAEGYYFSRIPTSATLYLVPTDKINPTGWSTAAISTFGIYMLSIARVGGPTGPAGPTGLTPTVNAAAAWMPAMTLANVACSGWVGMPISPLTIEPSDAFTQTANSVTVKDAGWYHVAAGICEASPSAFSLFVALSTSSTSGDGNIANGSGGPTAFSRAQCDGSIKLAAGATVYLHAYSPNTGAVARCFNFSIERIGGPTGGNATVPVDPWHIIGAAGEPALVNGWAATNGPTYQQPSFRKDPLGRVWIRGSFGGSPTAGGAFTLPVGYRPPAIFVYDTLLDNGAAGGYVQVDPSGNVSFVKSTSASIYVDVSFDSGTVTAMPTGPQGPAGPGVRGLVAVLPANPQDGDECYFQADVTNGVIWHLRYRAASSSAYKWEVIGGSDLYVSYGADEYGPLSAWAAVTGMQMTLPLAGDYLVRWGAVLYSNVTGVSSLIGISLNSTTAIVAGSIQAGHYNFQNVGYANYGERQREARLTGVPTAAVLRMLRQSSVAANGGVQNPWMAAVPIRVG